MRFIAKENYLLPETGIETGLNRSALGSEDIKCMGVENLEGV